MKKILFICKANETYGFQTYTRKSSGLFNSTRFVVKAINNCCRKAHAEIVEVVDGNSVDKEVFNFKPDAVVIEALWVTPAKFVELQRLHPKVKWFVHLHSNIPFLAQEGMAIKWVEEYAALGIGLLANSVSSYEGISAIVDPCAVTYLPNVYFNHFRKPDFGHREDNVINIGCFGAIRPMKNQLTQAIAALKFADNNMKYLRFHINGSRVEVGGDPILKNLRNLFLENRDYAELIEHPWLEPEDFLDMLKGIDVGMQVSMSETFNIVSADYVAAGIPIVVSNEIGWASRFSRCNTDSVAEIVDRIDFVFNKQWLIRWNQSLLRKFSANSTDLWCQFCQNLAGR